MRTAGSRKGSALKESVATVVENRLINKIRAASGVKDRVVRRWERQARSKAPRGRVSEARGARGGKIRGPCTLPMSLIRSKSRNWSRLLGMQRTSGCQCYLQLRTKGRLSQRMVQDLVVSMKSMVHRDKKGRKGHSGVMKPRN